MPWFFIRTVNSTFASADGGSEYEGLEQAKRAGINAGVEIAAHEIRRGDEQAGVEVAISNHQGKPVSRVLVTIATVEILPQSET